MFGTVHCHEQGLQHVGASTTCGARCDQHHVHVAAAATVMQVLWCGARTWPRITTTRPAASLVGPKCLHEMRLQCGLYEDLLSDETAVCAAGSSAGIHKALLQPRLVQMVMSRYTCMRHRVAVIVATGTCIHHRAVPTHKHTSS
jgi:hypothetical protein